jgi:hypothetical protein
MPAPTLPTLPNPEIPGDPDGPVANVYVPCGSLRRELVARPASISASAHSRPLVQAIRHTFWQDRCSATYAGGLDVRGPTSAGLFDGRARIHIQRQRRPGGSAASPLPVCCEE